MPRSTSGSISRARSSRPALAERLKGLVALRAELSKVEAEQNETTERLGVSSERSAELRDSLKAIEKNAGADKLRRELTGRLADAIKAERCPVEEAGPAGRRSRGEGRGSTQAAHPGAAARRALNPAPFVHARMVCRRCGPSARAARKGAPPVRPPLLVADEDPRLRGLLEGYLCELGYPTLSVGDGTAVIRLPHPGPAAPPRGRWTHRRRRPLTSRSRDAPASTSCGRCAPTTGHPGGADVVLPAPSGCAPRPSAWAPRHPRQAALAASAAARAGGPGRPGPRRGLKKLRPPGADRDTLAAIRCLDFRGRER
jgi:hypothetical protein